MRPIFLLALLGVRVGLCEVIELGKLDQYNPKSTNVPQGLADNAVWLSKEDGGYRMVPGSETSKQLQDVLGKCGQFDADCYNELNKAMTGVRLQTDSQLESRQLSALVSLAALMGAFISLAGAYLFGQPKEQLQHGVFIPDEQASSFSALVPGGTATLSADGSAIATVTQPAPVTSIQVSSTPTISVVEEDKDGLKKGDLDLQISPQLAQQLGDLIGQASGSCKDGDAFRGNVKRGTVKRGEGTFAYPGQGICDAEAAVANMVPGGMFEELLLIDMSKYHLELSTAVQKGQEALAVLATFIKAYSPLFAPGRIVSEQLAVVVLLLAYNALIDNAPIGEHNRIKSEMIELKENNEPSPSETSSGACPQPTELTCGMDREDCAIMWKEDEQKVVCADGEHKDCQCSTSGVLWVDTMDKEFAASFYQNVDLFKAFTPGDSPTEQPEQQPQQEKPQPNCPNQQSTLPAQVFWSKEGNRMFKPFCHNWTPDTSSEMIVDTMGRVTRIDETPPADVPQPPDIDTATPDQLPDWRVRFIFNKKDGADCSMTCDEAYESFGQICRASQDGLGGGQFRQGSMEIGCGTFLYHVYKLSTDRKGSSRCGHNIGSEEWGNEAAEKLGDSNLYTSGTDDNGACRVNSAGYGMSTFVQTFAKGKTCELFGYEMKHYRAVLKATGSAVCGSLHYDTDCLFTTNFISSGCKNS